MVPLFSLSADLGVRFLVQAFLSVMLGGIGTFEGPLLGAAIIGAMVPGFQWLREIPGVADAVSPVFAEVLVFVTALVIVKFRPAGLISKGRSMTVNDRIDAPRAAAGVGRAGGRRLARRRRRLGAPPDWAHAAEVRSRWASPPTSPGRSRRAATPTGRRRSSP